jgi:lysophospholipase L1-like esterase
VLHKWLPDADELATALSLRPSSPVTSVPGDAQRILTRLEAMQNLTRARGAEFIFLAPPLLTQDNIWPTVQVAAAPLGLSVLVPLRSAEVSSLDFSDGFHLNATGAALFTDRVAPQLRANLATRPR